MYLNSYSKYQSVEPLTVECKRNVAHRRPVLPMDFPRDFIYKGLSEELSIKGTWPFQPDIGCQVLHSASKPPHLAPVFNIQNSGNLGLLTHSIPTLFTNQTKCTLAVLTDFRREQQSQTLNTICAPLAWHQTTDIDLAALKQLKRPFLKHPIFMPRRSLI